MEVTLRDSLGVRQVSGLTQSPVHFVVKKVRSKWIIRLDEKCMNWRQQWELMCSEFGRYHNCYAGVKKAWMSIEMFSKSCSGMWIINIVQM